MIGPRAMASRSGFLDSKMNQNRVLPVSFGQFRSAALSTAASLARSQRFNAVRLFGPRADVLADAVLARAGFAFQLVRLSPPPENL
jgi:hypothetical protein